MKTRLCALAIATGALMLLPSAPAQAAAKCTASKARTVIDTGSARLFATPLGDGAARVYGCVYSTNRRFLLGIDGDCDPASVGGFILIGRYVGYVQTFCNIDASDDYVVVKDLKTGRVKWRAIAATGTRGDSEPSTLVSDLVLSRKGSIAWIADYDANSGSDAPHPNSDRQVRKLEPGAPAGGTLLDSGLAIEPRSLALGSRNSSGFAWLYWQKGSSSFAAKLN